MILVSASIISFKNKSPEKIGKIGETLIAKELNKVSKKGYEGIVLRNIYIPKDDGGTSEVDLVFITTRGIIVIESKNYSGYIYGKENDPYWTVVLNKNKKYSFYNPISQNRSHIKYLKEYLNIGNIPIFSIIVFSEHCVLKNVSITSHNLGICNIDCLHEYIEQIWEQASIRLTENQTKIIKSALLPFTNVSKSVKKRHINEIKDSVSHN